MIIAQHYANPVIAALYSVGVVGQSKLVTFSKLDKAKREFFKKCAPSLFEALRMLIGDCRNPGSVRRRAMTLRIATTFSLSQVNTSWWNLTMGPAMMTKRYSSFDTFFKCFDLRDASYQIQHDWALRMPWRGRRKH